MIDDDWQWLMMIDDDDDADDDNDVVNNVGDVIALWFVYHGQWPLVM